MAIDLSRNESLFPTYAGVAKVLDETFVDPRLYSLGSSHHGPLIAAFRRYAAIPPDVPVQVTLGSDDGIRAWMNHVQGTSGPIKCLAFVPTYKYFEDMAAQRGWTLVALNDESDLEREDIDAVYAVTPNNPDGRELSVEALTRTTKPILIDNAYAEFCDKNYAELASKPNVHIARTMSKAFGLAGLRIGFLVGSPALIIKRWTALLSSILAAEAALTPEAIDYMKVCVAEACTGREILGNCLLKSDAFDRVFDKGGAFVCARPRHVGAEAIVGACREKGLIIRQFGDYIRISATAPTHIILEAAGILKAVLRGRPAKTMPAVFFILKSERKWMSMIKGFTSVVSVDDAIAKGVTMFKENVSDFVEDYDAEELAAIFKKSDNWWYECLHYHETAEDGVECYLYKDGGMWTKAFDFKTDILPRAETELLLEANKSK